jgi:hypothetical protein
VKQRLELVDARVQFARNNLTEDIDEIVHNAGNSIERGIHDRTMTDDWKKAQVWESIARTQFGIDAELRISRVLHRLNEDLRLFQEDLRLFEEQIGIAGGAFLRVEHHSRLEVLMPPLRLGTRIINTLDTAARTTLWGGGVGAAGAGAAAYFLGPAVVMPLVGAAAPYVVPALLLAGLFTWLKTPEERRKYAEIRDKRNAFEKLVRDRLLAAQGEYEAGLEKVRDGFAVAASDLLAPVTLEAAAVERLPLLRKAFVDPALTRTNASLRQLTAQLQVEP